MFHQRQPSGLFLKQMKKSMNKHHTMKQKMIYMIKHFLHTARFIHEICESWMVMPNVIVMPMTFFATPVISFGEEPLS